MTDSSEHGLLSRPLTPCYRHFAALSLHSGVMFALREEATETVAQWFEDAYLYVWT